MILNYILNSINEAKKLKDREGALWIVFITASTSYVTALTLKRKWTRGVEGIHHARCAATNVIQVILKIY